MLQDKFIVSILRDEEKFIFLFGESDKDVAVVLREMGKMAADPEFTFTWYEAAVLSQKVRQLVETAKRKRNTL